MDKNHKIKIFNSINAVNSKTGAGFLLNNIYGPFLEAKVSKHYAVII